MNRSVDNISEAAYHASHQPVGRKVISTTALLPLFHESVHLVAMAKQSMDVVRKDVQHLNPGQTPVVTYDQPFVRHCQAANPVEVLRDVWRRHVYYDDWWPAHRYDRSEDPG